MELIDTHSHIYDTKDYGGDLEQTVERMREAGVTKAVMPNCGLGTIADLLKAEQAYRGTLYPLMGLHPEEVKEGYRDDLREIEKQLESHRYSGIGEVGLDYYWSRDYAREQVEVFEAQAALSVEEGLPLVIHTREAMEQTLKSLKKFDKTKLRGIFHCFCGTREEAEAIFECGDFWLGIGGVLTFAKSTGLRSTVGGLPLEKLVLETDSPYLAPVPHRGKRNESAYVRLVAEKVAEVKGTSLEEVADVTTKNAREIFELD